jgi:hypothetical protein
MATRIRCTTAEIYKNTSLALLGPKWDQLLAEARSLSSAGEHTIAVIIAAAAAAAVDVSCCADADR